MSNTVEHSPADRFGLQHFWEMRKLAKRADDLAQEAAGLTFSPKVVRTVGQQRFGIDAIEDAEVLRGSYRGEQWISARSQFVRDNLILLAHSDSEVVSLPDCCARSGLRCARALVENGPPLLVNIARQDVALDVLPTD